MQCLRQMVLALSFVALACTAASAQQPAEDEPLLRRPYSAGPLTAEDFQGQPDTKVAYAAWTSCDFQFNFEYRIAQTGNKWIATLKAIELEAVIERDKSWNLRPKDANLLEHEQGHFDISQIHALAARLELAAGIGNVDALRGTAANRGDAVKNLETAVREVLSKHTKEAQAANHLYDRETGNGSDPRPQAEAREKQRARLVELNAELEKIAKKK